MADRRLPLWVILVSTLVALGAAALAYGALDGPDDDPAGGATDAPLGDVDISDLSYQDLSGRTVPLTELQGRPIVINFFASWCTPCREEMPAFQAVSEDLAGEVTFLGLAVRDRPEDIRALVDEVGVTYAVGRDVDSAVGLETGAIVRMPGTVLVDADLAVVARHIGQLEEQELRDLIRDELGVEA